MKELGFRFISERSSFIMTMKSPQQEIDYFVSEFLSMFPSISQEETESGKCRVTIDPFQRNSEKLMSNIAIYVDKYKEMNPQVNKLRQFFNKLIKNEFFFFTQDRDFSSEDMLYITIKLTALNKNIDHKVVAGEFQDLFGQVVTNYEMVVLDNSTRHLPIGEPNRNKRICRFCGESQPKVRFRRKAHIIPEALGNKSIILYEECDTCNDKFSETIDRDIVNYFNLLRIFFGVYGKEGIPSMEGKDFKMRHVVKNRLEIDYHSNQDLAPHTFQFETCDTIEPQNIYRALCKYALSVIDKKHLGSFRNTVKWINREIFGSQLPKVATLITPIFFPSGPAIAVYRRINNNRDLPYLIGEFRFACVIFIFIVPMCSEDNESFETRTDVTDLWKLFKFYARAGKGKWELNDFSNTNRVGVDFRIVQKPKKYDEQSDDP